MNKYTKIKIAIASIYSIYYYNYLKYHKNKNSTICYL